MTKKRKVKKNVKYILGALSVIICILIICIFVLKDDTDQAGNSTVQSFEQTSIPEDSNNNDEPSQNGADESVPTIIQNEGDIEIIVPDDQESEGF